MLFKEMKLFDFFDYLLLSNALQNLKNVIFIYLVRGWEKQEELGVSLESFPCFEANKFHVTLSISTSDAISLEFLR